MSNLSYLKQKDCTTGSLRAEVVDDALLKNGEHTIVFHDQALGSKVEYRTASYSIVNAKGDSLIQREPVPTDFRRQRFSIMESRTYR